MRDVAPAVGGGCRTEGDEFLRRRIIGRGIDQGRANAQGSLFHGLDDQLLHGFQFLRGSRSIVVAYRLNAYTSRAQVGGNVGSYSLGGELVHRLTKGLVVGAVLFSRWARGCALAKHLQGYPLLEVRE